MSRDISMIYELLFEIQSNVSLLVMRYFCITKKL